MRTHDEEALVAKDNLRYLEHHNNYSDYLIRESDYHVPAIIDIHENQ